MEFETERASLVKGGVTWLWIALDRRSIGLEFYVKTDPRVEEVMKTLSAGQTDPLEDFGKDWHSNDTPLKVYRLGKPMEPVATYTLDNVGDVFHDKMGRVNISFLKIAGIGGGGGIRFLVSGYPMSRAYGKKLSRDVIEATRQFVKDYVSPWHIELKITSVEF